jgi:hypothetical protein
VIDNLAKLALNNGGSITPLIIPGELIDGTGLCNVSLFQEKNGDIIANIRHVHYTLYHSEFDQKFNCKWGCLSYLNPEDDIHLITGNYLCRLNPDTLEVDTYQKIDTLKNDITPIWDFHGLEDVRVFRWEDKLYVCGVRRDVKPNGEGRMELCEVEWGKNICIEQTRDRIEVEPHTYLEKNWMPIFDMPYHFVKWANPLEIVKVNPKDKSTETVQKGILNIISSETVISKDEKLKLPLGLRGSSPVILFGDEGDRMCITHETDFFHHPGMKKDAHYYHRFLIWDKDWNVKSLSKPFKFMGAMIEFCCGLLVKDNNLIMSYGYQDNAAYALKMPIETLNDLEWENLSNQPKIEQPEPSKPNTWHDPLIYNKGENLRFKFKGFENIEKNYSQCYQDLFVLSCLNGKRNGTYLEIGAGSPFYGNNTALLSELNWRGISLDILELAEQSWKEKRPNDKFIRQDAINSDYIQLCQSNGLPRYIDYLQLDIDPAYNTLAALKNIPLDILEFGVITYEHDFYIDKDETNRKESRKILQEAGYKLIAANISPDTNSPYEDWYINPKYIKEDIATDIDKEVLFAKDYMING